MWCVSFLLSRLELEAVACGWTLPLPVFLACVASLGWYHSVSVSKNSLIAWESQEMEVLRVFLIHFIFAEVVLWSFQGHIWITGITDTTFRCHPFVVFALCVLMRLETITSILEHEAHGSLGCWLWLNCLCLLRWCLIFIHLKIQVMIGITLLDGVAVWTNWEVPTQLDLNASWVGYSLRQVMSESASPNTAPTSLFFFLFFFQVFQRSIWFQMYPTEFYHLVCHGRSPWALLWEGCLLGKSKPSSMGAVSQAVERKRGYRAP